jgi:type VI protein secretion system component VasK
LIVRPASVALAILLAEAELVIIDAARAALTASLPAAGLLVLVLLALLPVDALVALLVLLLIAAIAIAGRLIAVLLLVLLALLALHALLTLLILLAAAVLIALVHGFSLLSKPRPRDQRARPAERSAIRRIRLQPNEDCRLDRDQRGGGSNGDMERLRTDRV